MTFPIRFTIFALLFICNLVCFDLSADCNHLQDDSVTIELNTDPLVKDQYPWAQMWFDTMVKKYPEASLHNVDFCISDNYEAGDQAIFFPEFVLKMMNQRFADAGISQANQAVVFKEFAECEYLLLHEAKHVMCSDFVHGSMFMDTAFKVFIASSLAAVAAKAAQNIDEKNDFALCQNIENCALTAAGTTAATFVPLVCLYARFQERRADTFANQVADKEALQAGILWFERCNTLLNFENIDLLSYVDRFVKFAQDPYHQTPKFRAEKARKAYQLRFGE